MEFYNTSERNIQIVLYQLKAHGINRVIASPGSTDIAIVSSMQHDPFFEMYSSIDERSACYMACGMAAETGKPVVIICTGATSSRNYFPGLAEAYYRHLPVLAITCCRSNSNVGHYINQVTDRSEPPKDTIHISVYAQRIQSIEDEWDCNIKINKAILGLSYNGGGPCHINLETVYSKDFSVKEIKPSKTINRYRLGDDLPSIPKGKIGIFVGNYSKWSDELLNVVDRFCEWYNAVVFFDHSSNYTGKYGVLFPLIANQCDGTSGDFDIDLMIHIGYVSAVTCKGRNVWRVNADGEIRDPFRRLTNVFQMTELEFFSSYTCNNDLYKENTSPPTLYLEYVNQYTNIRIMVINNGLGQEFKNYSSFDAIFGEDTDTYIAAKGHFNGRTTPVIECYAECLGFEYLAASNKDEFNAQYSKFVSPEKKNKPILFEVFTETEDESLALEMITTLTKKGRAIKKEMPL